MKHLTFEKARQEVTVLNALIDAEVIDKDERGSNDVLIENGFKKLLRE